MSKNWLDDLKVKFPTMTAGEATLSASNANKHPRDAVLALIANSRALMANPEFKIEKRGKPTKPETCFKLNDGNAEIVLRYAHEKLILPDGSTAIKVSADLLPQMLDALKNVVEAKAFDDQLAAIKSDRISALSRCNKQRKASKKAA